MDYDRKILGKAGKVNYNLPVPVLAERALLAGEGMLTASGALRVATGKYTGRSPNDKFVVDSPATGEIDWGNNKPISADKFARLYERMLDYAAGRELYVFDGFAGSGGERIAVRFINELAWQNLFVHQLFVRPDAPPADPRPDFTVICLPGFKADPARDGTNSEAFIILDFAARLVLIGGSQYAGEMKKSVFTYINYLMPKKGILSMHCSANIGAKGDTALFFGLSGTGKTTLSADPGRRLIGDDEHCWHDGGIFNVEGGCYAKCIKLKHETEPQIWEAIRFGAVLENVVVDEATREADFDSEAITENTRAAYPVDYIPGAVIPGVGGHPKTIVFLTADAFGVLPPVAKLSPEQAMYHFLSGYTSKLAGTERGITAPEATFSSCFGAPFLPLSPLAYAKLLGEKIAAHGTGVFLINTGWSGGPYGVGKRMSLPYTRAIVTAAIEGALDEVGYELDPVFNVQVPVSCPGVPAEVLKPRQTWADKAAYDKTAAELAARFVKNFVKFGKDVPPEITAAGPRG
ncbi:phosphoenolpyruvate carboxykinase (ATP) [Anaeroselena agilis]|uniref:Phosphoenolpyruvate carboxykinase (ATP) n=1 Tax=Anaeroselena agilis TaxID=3063788 RepID=A0ABU3P3G2_9FIRM|nr:phosphoenolpyruvate carboxykinase (ATP) [Selenomonadales bacterium 4137-cl]